MGILFHLDVELKRTREAPGATNTSSLWYIQRSTKEEQTAIIHDSNVVKEVVRQLWDGHEEIKKKTRGREREREKKMR